MELPRSTYYDQLDKGTLITADNLRVAAANLGINRAELLTRYRFIEPEEVTALAEEIRGGIQMHAVAGGGASRPFSNRRRSRSGGHAPTRRRCKSELRTRYCCGP